MARGRRDVVVVGLGRFGGALARELMAADYQVLGIDSDEKLVQLHSRYLTHAVVADATSADAMRQLDVPTFKTAVVAIGTEIEASILATALMVDLGIERVWAKAITRAHGAILDRVGAHRVVFPERDMGMRVAHMLGGQTLDYVQLDPGFALVETTAPAELVGQSLADAEVRRRYGITVVCVKHEGDSFTYATPETVVEAGDILVVAGETRRAEAFAALTA